MCFLSTNACKPVLFFIKGILVEIKIRKLKMSIIHLLQAFDCHARCTFKLSTACETDPIQETFPVWGDMIVEWTRRISHNLSSPSLVPLVE